MGQHGKEDWLPVVYLAAGLATLSILTGIVVFTLVV